MEVIVDKLQKSNVDIDMRKFSYYLNFVLDRRDELYAVIAARLNPEELPCVFTEMDVNSFWAGYGFLALVYFMNITEGAKRETVPLVAVIIKDMNITRAEGRFFQRMLSRIRRMFGKEITES